MQIAVIGVGLIGGSIALAARERLGASVAGFDSSERALKLALQRNVIDRSCETIAESTQNAQAVFVATPVGTLPGSCREALDSAPKDCVVTDVGSTKRAIVAALNDPRFVGGHPLAGAETSGVEHARGDLFEGATWYLTPTQTTSGLLYERLYRLLHRLGARPAAIEPDAHDAILATVSHLPHVLANVLVTKAANALGENEKRLPATGPSFRDATRVAGAATSVWSDIYLSNRDALTTAVEDVLARLTEMRDALTRGDAAWISDWNERAARDRRALLEQGLAGGVLCELRVSVPNRPGVVAQIALELGREGVNIADMALYPAPDMSEGVVALWISGDEHAGRAQALVEQLGFPVARA
jgi:prephenate dehydrogenase